ncbi:MAG: DUF4330 family protein [Clostridia bacterium]|nr:DUF4330 family protein [Clostridia bacterium]
MNKKRKLNIVDVAVIIVIILAVGFFVYNSVSEMETSGSKAGMRFVIEVPVIRTEMTDKIEDGDPVYNGEGKLIGTVQSVAVSPAYHEGSDESGSVVYSRMDGYSVLYVTVSSEALNTRYGYKIEDELYAVGKEYSLRTPDLYFEGSLVNIQKLEG